ncbi:MED11 [Acrasis kona]|uniref:MED11 n=1 Tax=Acrasis kona TaxID=1008807 RepID=A0AAW2ZCJ3_9EUKA
MKTLSYVLVILSLLCLAQCSDSLCPMSRFSNGNRALSVKTNNWWDLVNIAQSSINDVVFDYSLSSSSLPFRGVKGTECVKCQVDCLSKVRYWVSASQYYDVNMFSSCARRFIGYGCRKVVGCKNLTNLQGADYKLLYSALVGCAKHGGCIPTNKDFNIYGDKFKLAMYLAGVTPPIVGANSRAGRSI